MKRLLSSVAALGLLAVAGTVARAQDEAAALATPPITARTDDGSVEISSEGGTTYNNTAEGRVATFYGGGSIITNDAAIYCEHAEYNADTHEALLIGDVRIYRNDTAIICERAVYNFNTKGIRSLAFAGERGTYEFRALSLFAPGQGLQYNLRNGSFTTDDSSKPDYHLTARRIRLYPDDRVIYIDTKLYIGTTPVFYFPYFFQSLDQQSGYQITPGYTSTYGTYLLSGITFPITEHLTGVLRLDYRSERGIAGGINLDYRPNRRVKTPPSGGNVLPYASDDNPAEAAIIAAPETSPNNSPAAASNRILPSGASVGDDETASGLALTGEALSRQVRNKEGTQLLTYFLHDDKPGLNRTSLDRIETDVDRYRLKVGALAFFTDDLFLKIDADKLSDRYLLQDFFEGEFTKNPNPDNVAAIAYYQPTFISTLTARVQANSFFDTTERLPEFTVAVPRLPLGGTGLYWESDNSVGFFHRNFDNSTPLPQYDTFRADTFHQFTFPQTLFGWLNVVPRVGGRVTYYTHSAPQNSFSYALQYANDTNAESLLTLNPAFASASDLKRAQQLRDRIGAFQVRDDIVRPVLNVGMESSFKVSRVYDNVESRALGLDKLQHIVQPYVDVAFIDDFGVGSRELLQFDRLLPTTQLQPIDFPQFNSIDTIDETSAARIGVRNRLQTKRDALTFDWLEIDTFFQANIYQPDQNTTFANTSSTFSNLFNQFTFRPLPWISLTVDSQLPVFKKGFTEVDTALAFQATSNLDLSISHRYLNNNPFFRDSSLLRFNVFYRIDENWAAGFSERYEFADRILQAQSYTLYRDLSSFVASLGVTVRNNNGVSDYGVLLNFTLKGVPKVSLPVGFDVNALDNQSSQ